MTSVFPELGIHKIQGHVFQVVVWVSLPWVTNGISVINGQDQSRRGDIIVDDNGTFVSIYVRRV